MRRFAAPLLFLATGGIAVSAFAADDGRAAPLRTLFEYCQGSGWSFDSSGRPTTNAIPGSADGSAEKGPCPDLERFAFGCAAKGTDATPEPFLAWMEEECSIPGESAFIAGWNEGGVFVLSEHGSAVRCLKRYDIRSEAAECLTPTNAARDLLGPLLLPSDDGSATLAGVRWRTESGTSNEWYDAQMAAAERMLAERFPGARHEWIAPSPVNARRWIVACRFPDAPSLWASVDADKGSVEVLSRFPGSLAPMVRRVFRCRASDGESLCGIFSHPAGDGPFPLVVFPHGGPGALSDETFDERVWALVEGGFAVLQPNYRGSAGFGKGFRLDGWGPDGIRRAMDDIFEMAVATRDDPALPVAKAKPLLLGGSWGGYCALEQLAQHPDFYAGGVSFFGAFDLPALVRSEMDRIESKGSPDAERDLQALIRQFGDPSDAQAMERLAALSPVNNADAIAAPPSVSPVRRTRTRPGAAGRFA